jgi:hypothetical protein
MIHVLDKGVQVQEGLWCKNVERERVVIVFGPTAETCQCPFWGSVKVGVNIIGNGGEGRVVRVATCAK